MRSPDVIIKFVSVDGLTRYEPTRTLYGTTIDRVCTRLKKQAWMMDGEQILDTATVKRTYVYSDTYYDNERGIIVKEYREQL